MASSSNATSRGALGKEEEEAEEEENVEEQELEGFDDFTLASSWERFISEIEAACRLWMVDGPKNLIVKGAECLDSPKKLYKVKCDLKYSIKSYCMEYYFETTADKALGWDDDLHYIQLSFGVKEFLVIAPQSVSGVVLDAPESSKLLSAVAIALSNCGSNWPAFVPVHDPSRKAYIGIQNMGTIFTRRFDADRIGSQVPIRLMHLEGLYELFVSKFAYSSLDFPTSSVKVNFAMRLTYRTPLLDDEAEDTEAVEAEVKESKEDTDAFTRTRTQWDDDCPWAEWYSAEDPIQCFELVAIWSSKIYDGSLEMAELENASSFDAETWLLCPVISPFMMDDSTRNLVGFGSQLRLLIRAFDMSFEAKFLEDFVSVENLGPDNAKSSLIVPPPTVRDRVLKELFHEGVPVSNYMEVESKHSRAIKGAPLHSLFAQFCLHSLWFGNCNIRAIAVLWIEFVREVRWYWEESQPIPRMPTNSGIDLSACLVHQKMQMLAICIQKKALLDQELQTSAGIKDHGSISHKDYLEVERNQFTNSPCQEKRKDHFNRSLGADVPHDLEESVASSSMGLENADLQSVERGRRGSTGAVGSMMLLRSPQKMHVPHTQEPPIMTEDMHDERLLEACNNAFSISGQLEKDILSSDMSAFKAANPDAVFEDFIRWYSPTDWDNGETEGKHTIGKIESEACHWPPRGKLSERMSEHGNSWRQIWNDSPTLAASEQKPHFDPTREGEKVLHYLETLRPHQLLEQMICTAFRAAADTLNETPSGEFKLMKTKMDQFYLTLVSGLKPLQGNFLHDRAEFIGDLRRLCLVFENIEKLLIFSVSIHLKLSETPRLSEAIFNDFFNFYLPKMGTGSASICYDKLIQKFSTKQRVNTHERDVVASLFPPPTANQSWRKVLSMGNLLNGHEPILREIVFSVHNTASDCQYGSSIPGVSPEEIETYRMFICGTSNDLQVALSVTSWD